ncbi:MAG: hypothetical protein M1833_004940 [Piccolia ochrophora]|nr:MAG: hypothetical protein M1833_004940 [Piccolia ochrophora]
MNQRWSFSEGSSTNHYSYSPTTFKLKSNLKFTSLYSNSVIMSDKGQKDMLGSVTGTIDDTLTGGKGKDGQGGLLGGVTDTLGSAGGALGGATHGAVNTVDESARSVGSGVSNTVGGAASNVTGDKKS